MQLKRVSRVTTSQTVATQLLDLIRQGAVKPGDQLPPEKELMERLQVGRSTVREALQILSTLNVVEASAGHGTFVRRPTASEVLRPEVVSILIGNEDALELLEAREMIEPQCVRLAAIRGTVADFDALSRLLDQHEEARLNNRPVSEYAARFHVMLAEASKNKVAASFMDSILGLLMERGRRFDMIPDFQAKEIEQHREILEVVRSRDPDRAATLMLSHIVESAATFDREGVVVGKPLLAVANRPAD
jgi:GntR family transcriptional repressor for pyruvate dehydrogenase complex